MANKPYENFVLANEVEDQYKSHLDLMKFCTVDSTLELVPGMKKVIHTYKATDGTEKLTQGVGNSKSITASHTPTEYTVALAQNRFEYYDEELMKDPLMVQVGMRHAGTDLFNTVNADIYAEFKKATLATTPAMFDFDAFVDAGALLNVENLEGIEKFAFVSNKDMAEIRKKCKDTLQYVSDFATRGYVGTLGDWNLYVKKDAEEGVIYGGTRAAVTLFNKKGVEVEQVVRGLRSETAANTRLNTIFSRKYYIAALTDATKAVKMTRTPKV